MIILFSNFLIVATFLFVAILVGVLLLTLCKTKVNDYVTFFQATLIGAFSIVMLFAVWHTRGKTILSGFLLLGVFLIFFKKNWRTTPFTLDASTLIFAIKRYAELVVVGVLIILYKMLFFDGSLAESVYMDYVLYAKLSEYLLLTGFENTSIDYVLKEGSATPYHYYDIWLNASLLYFSKANKVTLMVMSTLTIGIAVTWSGYVALASSFGLKLNIFTKAVCCFFLFSSGIYIGRLFQVPFIESTAVFTNHVFNYSKLFPIYWLCLLLLIKYRQRSSPGRLVLIALVLPLVNISIAPGIFILIGIYLGYVFLTDRKGVSLPIAQTFVVGVFIMAFYLINAGEKSDLSFSFENAISTDNLRTIVNIMIGAALQFALIYCPLWLAVYYKWFNEGRINFEAIGYFLAIYLSFILPWAFFNSSPNSIQLFSNFFVPFVASLSFFILCFIISDKKNGDGKYILNILLIVCLPLAGVVTDVNERVHMYLLHKFPSEKLVAIRGIIRSFDNPVGVYFRSNYDWASKYTVFGALDQGLQEYVDREKFHTVSLSIFDIPLDSMSRNYPDEKGLVMKSIFGKYLKRYGAIDETHFVPKGGLNLVDYQMKYIQEYDVDYALADINYIIPEELKTKFKRSLKLDEYQIVIYY